MYAFLKKASLHIANDSNLALLNYTYYYYSFQTNQEWLWHLF